MRKKTEGIKEEIRVNICNSLTRYETSSVEPIFAKPATEWMDEFYLLLLKIQNNWEELTGEQG